jgi:hypothetical protein
MSSLTEDVRNESQRGLLLRILADWQMEWMPFSELRLQAMRRAGYPVEESRVRYHLNYLIQNGYAELKHLRAGRADIELTAVRATPKAVDLVEGRIAPDPAIGL